MTVDDSPQEAAPVPQDIEIGELLRRLWRGKRWIAACTLGLAAATAGLAFWMTPVYRASVVIVASNSGRANTPTGAASSLLSLASMAGVDLPNAAGSQVQEALAVLRGREFGEGFIVEQRLLPEFYPKLWDTARNTWNEAVVERPTLSAAFRRFNLIRTIDENKKTGLVTVQIDWKDPAKAAAWANECVSRLNEVMRRRAIERTDAYLEYLQKEFESTSAMETRTAISRLMEAQINERMLANVTKEYVFRVVDRALVPDARDPVRPQKLLMILEGTAAGFVLGVLAVLIAGAAKESRARTGREREARGPR